MAQVQDLSGLLTGISSQAPIDPRVNLTPMQALRARGYEANQGLRKAAGGLMSTIAGKEVNVQTSRERAQTELAGLDINDPRDQPRILEIYTRLDPNKAAQLKAAFAQQGRARLAKGAVTEKTAARQGSIVNAIKTKYPDRTELQEMAKQGVSFKEINDFAKAEQGERYLISGKNVWDKLEGKFITPPDTGKREVKNVKEIYDEKLDRNVLQYTDKYGDVIKTDMVAVDKEQESATAMNLREKSMNAALESNRSKMVAEGLVEKLEREGPNMSSGLQSSFEEAIKGIGGYEDMHTVIRTEINNLRAQAAIANLPVGPASDKDVALVLGGQLSPNANPEVLIQWARGLAKLAAENERYHDTVNAWSDRYNGSRAGLSAYLQKEQARESLAHTSVQQGIARIDAMEADENTTDADMAKALSDFNQAYGFDLVRMQDKLERADKTLRELKREDF